MAKPPRYRIHPAIGIARVGNAAANEFFIGPERPGQAIVGVGGLGVKVPPFKTGGLVRRQAARFRVFEYVESGGTFAVSREINLDEKDVAELTWKVHLANRKASFFEFDGLAGSPILKKQPKRERRNKGITDRRSLEIDPLPRTITGKSAGPVEFRKGTSKNPANELWPKPQPSPAIEYLGEIRTDDKGRLIVIGGQGIAAGRSGATITGYANNDGWFDDVSDGPISATLRLKQANGTKVEMPVEGAWVLVGPPDFAPEVPCQVSLYDLLLDLAVREQTLPVDEALFVSGDLARLPAMAKDLAGKKTSFSSYKPSFDLDILPILRGALSGPWVFEPVKGSHGTFGAGGLAAAWPALSDPTQPNSIRAMLLGFIRKPDTPGLGADTMPKLLGDDPYDQFKTKRWGLSLTVTQYACVEQWAKGNFTATKLGPSGVFLPPVVGQITPHGLDRAILESVSGGAFYPGIEVGWQIRDARLFAGPFRIKHGAPSVYVGDRGVKVGAGHFSRQMALPWLADFLECKAEQQQVKKDLWGWWPFQRPDSVFLNVAEAKKHGTMRAWPSGSWPADPGGPAGRPADWPSYAQFVKDWHKLGFVVRSGDEFVETERASAVP